MRRLTAGQRVLQPHHTDATSPVPPHTPGRVHHYDPATDAAVIDWDNNVRQTVPADILLLPVHSSWESTVNAGLGWALALNRVRADGEAAGYSAAGQWCHDTLGDRAAGDIKVRARMTLRDLDDGAIGLIEGLPHADLADTDISDLPDGAGTWAAMTSDRWEEIVAAYRGGSEDTMLTRIADQCRTAISPTGDGRDLSHLSPKNISIGRAGVFSGEWLYQDDDGPGRFTTGFAGILTGRWNGWAVFSCTRQVAEAIVAQHEADRDTYRTDLRSDGLDGDHLDQAVDEAYAHLYFDGDTLVADQRRKTDDPTTVERLRPDHDGQYTVMGRNWCWDAVDPVDCDTIIGDLPAPGQQQQYVLLRHTPGLQVPHDRLRVTDVQRRTTSNGEAFTGMLTLDGLFAGTVQQDGTGGPTETYSPNDRFGRRGMLTYLAGSRLHGQPLAEDRLLDALVTEAELDQTVARLTVGTTVARLIDDDGHTHQLRPVAPTPHNFTELPALHQVLATESTDGLPSTHWEMWTGQRWLDLRAFGAHPGTVTGGQVGRG